MKHKKAIIFVVLLLGLVSVFRVSQAQITANITSDLTTEDSLNARLLAFDREVGGNLIATADINTISPDRFGSFSVTIPDDLLILPNVSYVQLCLDGDVSARPLSLADDANDPTTLPTTSSSSQSSLDGTADCNDATNAAHTYELTSCQRQPIPTNPSWLSRTFGTAQQTFHVDNFCGQVFASADVEQLAQTNQLPQLQLNGDTLTLGESSVDLSKYLQEDTQPTVITNTITGTGTDDQTIDASLSNQDLTVSIEDGGSVTVDLSAIDTDTTIPNTDNQALGLTGTTLSITGGNSIDLSPIDTDTDDQTLTFTPGTGILEIADGNTVDLSALYDNTDQLASLSCGVGQVASWNGSVWVCSTVSGGGVDADNQVISLAGNTLTLSGGLVPDTTVDLSSYLDNTDDQVIAASFAGNNLTISLEDGGVQVVDLSSLDDNGTDDQMLSLVGTDLTIEDGNTIDLSSIDTDTDDQTLSFNSGTGELTIADGNMVDMSAFFDDTTVDNQQISLSGNIITLDNGTGADTTVNLTPYLDNTDNQVLSISGNTLELTSDDGTDTVDLSGYLDDTTVDNQALSLSGNDLELTSDDGTDTVDLSGYLDNTDGQTLGLTGSTLSITGGNNIDLSPIDTDTDDQTLIFTPGTGDLEIADGNTVNLNALYDNTDNQVLSISGNNLQLSSDDGTDTIDLSSYLDNTDELASLSCSPTEIAKWNGTNWACAADEVDDADSSATNEIQDLSLSGNTLSLTSDGTTVDLSSYLDNTDELAGLSCSPNEIAKYSGAAWACAADIDTTIADDQTLSFNSGTGELTIADGNMVDMSAFFDDTTVDNQQISLSGNIITLDNGTGADTTVNLTPYLDNTDNQVLSISGNTLELTSDDGTDTVDLSGYLDNTDAQDLSLSGNTLALTNDGTTVDLSSYLDNTDTLAGLSCSPNQIAEWDGSAWVCLTPTNTNTDNQQIALAANIITLSNGTGADTTVNLSSYLDNTDELAGLSCSPNEIAKWSGAAWACAADNVDDADNNATNEIQDISLSGTTLTITSGSSIDLSPIDTDTDDQTLIFTPGTGDLEIADGNTVNLNALYDNTDTLAALSCGPGQVAQWNGASWVCATVSSGGSDTDNQVISLSGDTLTLSGGLVPDSNVDLSGYLDDTDDQTLSFNSGTGELTIADGNMVDMSAFFDDTTVDNQQISLSGNIITLDNGTGADTTVNLTPYLDNTDNQVLSISGNTLELTSDDGTDTVDLSGYLDDTTVDNQALSLSGNDLELTSDDGTDTVDLSGYLDNTDGQTLGLTGSTLSITGGNNIDLSPIDTDTDDQTLIFTPGTGDLEIADGNTVNLNALYDNTDNQVLSISGNNLQLSSDDGTDTIDLSSYLDNTDELASLSCSPTEIAKWNGTNWACAADEVDDADSSATNEIQDLSLSGNTLSLTSDGTTVDLSSYLDNTDELAGLSCSPNEIAKYSGAAWACAADIDTTIADDQTLSFNSGTGELTIADGNMVDMSAFFDDTTVDNQQISLSGNIITLDNGTGADTTVNLTPYLDNTDNQVLSISGNTLELTSDDGTDTVDLSGYLDNTDAQDLSLSGNTLALTNDGTTVDLSSYLDNTDTLAGLSCSPNQIAEWDGSAWVCLTPTNTNTDNQQIALAANIITLSNGTGADTTVNLSSYLDNTDELAGLSCSPNEIAKWSGAAWACAADNVDDADNNATNEIQDISLSGTTLTITSGSSIDLSPIDTDTDDQTLIFTPGTGDLEIADGNTVNLNALYDNTDNQVLSISGNNLQLSSDDGTDTIDLSSYLDNTDELASLSCSPTEIAKWNGTNWACAADEVDDADSSATNEIQDLSLSGNTLSLTSDGTTVDLSSYLDNTDELAGLSCSPNEIAKYSGAAWACAADIDTTIADDQTLSFNSGTGELTIADGNMVDMSAFFDDTTVDNQQISLSGNIITLDNGTGADTTVNLTPYLDNTDNQVLSISGNTLELTSDDGTDTVDLSGYLDDTTVDNQALSLSGNDLELTSDDGTDTVDLSPYLDDTVLDEATVDAYANNNGYLTSEVDGSITNELQDLNLNADGFTLEISGGTSANLSPLINTDVLAGLSCSPNEIAKFDGLDWNCAVDVDTDTVLDEATVDAYANNNGYLTSEVDGSVTNEVNTNFTIAAGNMLQITDSDGTLTVDLSSYLDDTVLDEATVDAYANNNGYLTSEVDAIVGNEVVNATTNGGLVRSGAGSAGDPYTLGLRTDCGDNEVLAWDNGSSSWSCELRGDINQDGNSFGGSVIIGSNDPENLEFETSGTSRVFLDTNGDLGIGAASTSNQRLYVQDNSTSTTGFVTASQQLGPYTFDADNDADETAWTFVSDNGTNGLNPANTARAWSHDTNDTTSNNVGPTSGQGGAPDGYIYTEASAPAAAADTFHITNNTTIDASSDSWQVQFYWNQRGDANEAIVEVQTNEASAGWVTRGTYATGGPNVATGGADIWNFESLDLTGVISNASTEVRFLVTLGSTAPVWNNDFGLDTILISTTDGGFTYGDTVSEVYNADATSDVDLLRLSSDVGGTQDVKFRVDSDGDVFSDGSNFVGGGADLAENYLNTDGAQPGDVVVFANERTVKKSSEEGEQALAGVVSTYPGVILDSEVDGVPVALSGRAPTNVSVENGPIEKGDFLTSGPDGVARKAVKSGRVIGIAMEPATEDGQIDVFVSLGYYSVPLSLDLSSVFASVTVLTSPEEVALSEGVAEPEDSSNEDNVEEDLTSAIELLNAGNAESAASVEDQIVSGFTFLDEQINDLQERVRIVETSIVAQPGEDEPEVDIQDVIDEEVKETIENLQDNNVPILDIKDQLTDTDLADAQTVITDIRVEGELLVLGSIILPSNISGTTSISAGQDSVDVVFSIPHSQTPNVTISPRDFVDTQWKVDQISATSFRISIKEPQDDTVRFEWQALTTE